MKHINIPVFVPHIGCPFDCVFCNQKHITGVGGEINEEETVKTIEEHLLTIPGDALVEIAFFGGSFTGIEESLRRRYLEIASGYIKSGKVSGIRLSTRPDYITREILDELKEFGVTAIELGVQSMDDSVLELCGRGHTAEDVKKASALIKEYGFELGLQMMTGLPGDTDEGAERTCEEIIKLRPDCVRIYPTLVIKDTRLAEMYSDGEYKPQELDTAVELSAKLLRRFRAENIRVIRIALMTTDEISPGGKLLAGPFHSSFRELVESRIFLEDFLEKLSGVEVSKKIIFVNPVDLSKAIGNRRENIKKINESLGMTVKIVASDTVKKGEFRIENDKE